MNKILAILLLGFSFNVFSQEVKLKKEMITVDGNEWGKYEGCGMFDRTCSFYKNDQEIVLSLNTVNDPAKRIPANPEGRVTWFEVKFLGTNLSFESNDLPKNIAKIIYKANVFNEYGSFNTEKIQRLIEKYGHPFSSQYYNNNNNTQTVIIQDNTEKSGINIRIGK